jgi:hypothetical protein
MQKERFSCALAIKYAFFCLQKMNSLGAKQPSGTIPWRMPEKILQIFGEIEDSSRSSGNGHLIA